MSDRMAAHNLLAWPLTTPSSLISLSLHDSSARPSISCDLSRRVVPSERPNAAFPAPLAHAATSCTVHARTSSIPAASASPSAAVVAIATATGVFAATELIFDAGGCLAKSCCRGVVALAALREDDGLELAAAPLRRCPAALAGVAAVACCFPRCLRRCSSFALRCRDSSR